jgi:hypothetical protein
MAAVRFRLDQVAARLLAGPFAIANAASRNSSAAAFAGRKLLMVVFFDHKIAARCADVPRDQVECEPIARLSRSYNKFCLQRDRFNDRRGARC